MRIAAAVKLTQEQRQQLKDWRRGRKISVRLAQRARILLLAAEGVSNKAIGELLAIDRRTAGLWRARFNAMGWVGLERDAFRPGRKRTIDERQVQRIIDRTLNATPEGMTHWSTRTMAATAGVSASTIRRIWVAHGLKPHRIKSFKLSNDKAFVEKLEDIVGLYLHPPEHALVLCGDEKSQIQALDRTQPGLPLRRGRCQTFTHDYKRNGTTTLFAALNTLDGTIINTCMEKHRHQEWLKFLQQINRETPKDKTIHLIVDNYATHKHPKVKAWLKKNPRFHMHFTPTSASWLNMVERFFRDLTEKQLRRGVHRSVKELKASIDAYIEQHNNNPKPFIWTAKASDILEKVIRGREKLNKVISV